MRQRVKEYTDIELSDKEMRKLRQHKALHRKVDGYWYCIKRANSMKERKIAKLQAQLKALRNGG